MATAPLGTAKSVCPEAPYGVLALTRMVAVPKEYRELNHVSKPLKRQMRSAIDRTRWPVLITYSDEGKGHTGHTYKCSGWQPTTRSKRPIYEVDGKRISCYSNGRNIHKNKMVGYTYIQRWEHWICAKGKACQYMKDSGWIRVPVKNKRYKNGKQAYTFVNKKVGIWIHTHQED